jgi:hypothetical protein
VYIIREWLAPAARAVAQGTAKADPREWHNASFRCICSPTNCMFISSRPSRGPAPRFAPGWARNSCTASPRSGERAGCRRLSLPYLTHVQSTAAGSWPSTTARRTRESSCAWMIIALPLRASVMLLGEAMLSLPSYSHVPERPPGHSIRSTCFRTFRCVAVPPFEQL